MDHAVPVIKISDMQDRLTHIPFWICLSPDRIGAIINGQETFPGYALGSTGSQPSRGHGPVFPRERQETKIPCPEDPYPWLFNMEIHLQPL